MTEILRGETTVMLREELAAKPARVALGRASTPAATSLSGAGETRFEALRRWRAAEAKGQKVPPYVIFHDTVLREISAVLPQNLDDLGLIKGVGASKLARYGNGVLAVLAES